MSSSSRYSDSPPASGSEATATMFDASIQDIVVIIEELRSQLHQAGEVNRTLQAELDKSKARCDSLREVIDARDLELNKVREGQRAYVREQETMLADLRAGHDEQTEAAREIRRLREQVEDLNLTRTRQEDELRSLRAVEEELRMAAKARKETLQHAVTDQTDRIHDLEEQLDERVRELAKARDRIEELESEQEETQLKLRRLERAQADLEKVRNLMQAFAFGPGRNE